MKQALFAIALLLFSVTTFAQRTGTLADSRDGQTYKTVTYTYEEPGGITYDITWMAENLNYEMNKSYCYLDKDPYCKGLGRLYTWDAAMEACPEGWHLPKREEWEDLIEHLGGEDVAGVKMKNDENWLENGNGTNESKFAAKPGGFRNVNGTYVKVGTHSYFWTSTIEGTRQAWYYYMTSSNDAILYGHYDHRDARSCRCVKDNDKGE